MKTNKRMALCAALTAALAGAVAPARAEDRALLIGVGKYQMESANLPGIDLDIGIMKEVAEHLGFKPHNVKVVMDREATLDNVRRTFKTWLEDGVGPDDRVLIYFSGHGAQIPDENGDEQDGLDEVLTMHDLRVASRGGKRTLEGVLVDDEFAQILSRIRSRKVLVLADACHSGTSTKGVNLGTRSFGTDEGMVKAFHYDLEKPTRSFVPTAQEASSDNYVSVAAAADTEQSIATRRGSLFTLGVKDAVVKAKEGAAAGVTPRAMWRVSTEFVARNVSGARLFHPQLTGSTQLADQPLTVADTSNGTGPVWRKLESMVAGAAPLTVALNQGQHREGEKLVIEVDVQRAGYLNVVNVGPDDMPIVLYPNQFNADNRVEAGRLRLPTAQMKFDLVAQPPHGRTLVVAFLTDQPVNLYTSGDGRRDATGKMMDTLGRPSEDGLTSMRSFQAQARTEGSGGSEKYRAGKAESRICQKNGC